VVTCCGCSAWTARRRSRRRSRPAKAQTAALGRRESKVYEDMINAGSHSFLSAPLQGMLEGGVPIVVEGQCVGAVGVSGVKSTEDAQIARAGIAALGL
jgi:glc operon protein GlcG